MKKTEWLKGNISPKHVGAYETIVGREKKTGNDYWFNWWDGNQWCVSGVSARNAKASASMGATYLPIKWWRGLTEKA
jgi:hypothetical protein